MSIEHGRRAARQWTAASLRGEKLQSSSRRRRLASWLLIVPTLSLFSFSLIAGAQTGKPDYEKAAKQLSRDEPLMLIAASEQSEGNFLDQLVHGYTDKALCSVTSLQLREIGARYDVGHMTITVEGADVDVVTVSGKGANDHELRTFLGDPKLRCKFVRRAGIFYLPFDAQGS